MKKTITYLCLLLPTFITAQQNQSRLMYSSSIQPNQQIECIPKEIRAFVDKEMEQNLSMLKASSKLNLQTRSVDVLFDWPLRLASGRPNLPYHVTGNYVDLDQATSAITDYNCGTQSYNNHSGIDIGLTPFGWKKMDDNDVEIIAAAEGQIIGRRDGDFDRNCGASAVPGNYIFVQHSDGTKAYYYHMKNGSVTSKVVGDNVSRGEYLGVVGSSGNSSGPHLHFEVRSSTNALIDPYNGTCNNITSRWTSQRPYREPTIHLLSTHAHQTGPIFPSCPTTETPRIKTNFQSGDLVDFFSYFHDQDNGHSVAHRIYRPNNSIYNQWASNFTSYIQVSLWAASWYLPTPAPQGTWRYEATYQGQTVSTNFTVNVSLPVELLNFNIFPTKKSVELAWETATERNNAYFIIERSSNGEKFEEISRMKGAGNSENNIKYSFSDTNPLPLGYYRLKQVDDDGQEKNSHILTARWHQPSDVWSFYPNPVKDKIVISGSNTEIREIRILNGVGQVVLTHENNGNEVDVSPLVSGIYFIELSSGLNKSIKKFVKR